MKLTEEERKSLVNIRLGNAKNTYSEVALHVYNGLWNTAANRLYYACYYAVGALLVHNGISATTHQGVINQFGLHFVANGKVSMEQGKLFRRFFELRQSGDYDDVINITKEEVFPLLEPAEQFIKAIERLIYSEEK
ncbi:MAG: HEPN domain-containing protein [Dysgonamonadaceae bacterium]|jgi:uncharacterized protein (UPF0332 family)|nr:HEPN domain-containing protein [Dysgonamonadaceae bacterium]